jgi:hypothetical protein
MFHVPQVRHIAQAWHRATTLVAILGMPVVGGKALALAW